MRKKILGIIVALHLIFPSWATCMHGSITEAEVMFLPPYCKARYAPAYAERTGAQENAVARKWGISIKKWRKIIGRDFMHIHHY